MVLGPLIKSTLKETVEKLPEDFAMKSESIPNMLVKQGVKPEELKFAKLGIPEGKVTKQDLVQAEAGRQDRWSVHELSPKGAEDARFEYVTLRGEESNPTYAERVYKWQTPQQQSAPTDVSSVDIALSRYNLSGDEAYLAQAEDEAIKLGWDPNAYEGTVEDWLKILPAQRGYTSNHFPDTPGYLMHARTIDQDLGDGKKTRTILELQSDLHQQGRQYGYKTADVDPNDMYTMRMLLNSYDRNPNGYFLNQAGEIAQKYGWDPEGGQSLKAFVHQQSGAPKAPLESNWLRKLMEFEVARGIEDGADQIAIPLKGPATESLARGSGVSKWYDTVVKSTAEKLAKQTGGTAELISTSKGSRVFTEEQRRVAAVHLREIDAAGDDWETGLYDDAVHNADMYLRELGVDPFSFDSTAEALEAVSKKGELPVTPTEAEYIVIKPGEKARTEGFKLYASGGASVAALTVANALNQGVGEDDISTVLKEQGYSDAEIQKALDKGKKAQLALSQGVAEEDIRTVLDEQEPQLNQQSEQQPQMQNWQGVKPAYNYLTGESDTVGQQYSYNRGNYTPTLQERRDQAYQTLMSQEKTTARDLVTSLQVLSPALVSLTDQAKGALGNKLKAKQVEEAEKAARAKVISMAQDKGITLQWQGGEYYAQTPEGQWAKVTPGMWDQLWAMKGETVGAVAGAVAGARAGAAIPAPHPLAKLALGAAGSVVGAAVGSATGAEADYLYTAMKQSEELSAKVAAHKAITAAEWSVIGDVIGYPVAKLTGAAVKGIMKARDFIKTGNTTGAYRALKDTMFISDSEAQELTDKLAKQLAVPGSNEQERAIVSTAITKPGGEQLVRAATSASPRVSQAVLQSIDSRAKSLLEGTKTKNVGTLLRQDLDNYVSDVKQFFSSVKDEAMKAPNASRVQFNYDKLAVEPLMQRLEGNIQDDAVLNRFKNLVMRVRETSDSRTFPDLLELRQIVTGFKYNSRIANAKDFQAIDAVLGNIDNAITQSAQMAMPGTADAWLTKYAQARAKYAQMLKVESNVLVEALRKPGLSRRDIGKLLVKHIDTEEGTFDQVLSKLPINARKNAEMAVIDTLANKFTVGKSATLQVTDFVKLNDRLEDTVFTTPEARQMKQAIAKIADVFKNDPQLAKAAGSTHFAQEADTLSTNPVTAARLNAARQMFRSWQKYFPTERGRGIALVNKVAELLDNPLHAKSVRDIIDEMPEVTADVQKLQQEYAKAKAAGKDVGAARVKLYGDGKVLDARASQGAAADTVPLHRIATLDQVKEVAEAEGLTDGKLLDAALKKRGYVAVMQGSTKVRKL